MINNSNFLLTEIPDYSPHSPKRLEFWKAEKRKIHEGYWVGGKWMPPNLYFYVNFWKILLNKTPNSKTKELAKPFLRDLEWEKCYIMQEAKGFSGFELDTEFTCHRAMSPLELEITKTLYPNLYESLKSKTYIPARDYLRRIHSKGNLGKALYENHASNVIDIEARGTGKSYGSSSEIGHNFITDGALDYDMYLEKRRLNSPYSSETVVGAYDSKWSADLLRKVKLGLSSLEGSTTFNGRFYPSPLAREYAGSWESGKTVIQEFDVKENGVWITKGTRSKIQHRTFKDNPFAANGTRGNLNFIEEVGFMANLRKTLGAMKECTSDGDTKFGVIWGLGTGGDMEGGATEEAKKVFYNASTYDCLEFDDIYENTGSIGLFIPSHMGFNEFRDSEGNIIKEKALQKSNLRREKARTSSDRRVYLDEIQNRPEKPSEAFFSDSSNILDIPALQAHQQFLESKQDKSEIRGLWGELIINSIGKVEFIRDVNNKLEPADFPVKKGKQPDGCVVIWELPDEEPEKIPYGMYIAATDPYDQDKAPNTVSMGSTFIMKRFTLEGIVYRRIVAEYTGRPTLARIHHETVRRLLMFYKATDLYENERNTMKMHFEQKKSLHLLADTPDIIKTATSSKIVKTGKGRGNKGIGMPPKQQQELIFFVKEYLEEEVPNMNGICYLHTINSIPLLKELIAYNDTGNFDRLISFMLLILYDNQMYNIKGKNLQNERKRDIFFERFKLGNKEKNNYYNNNSSYIQRRKEEGKPPLLPNLLR